MNDYEATYYLPALSSVLPVRRYINDRHISVWFLLGYWSRKRRRRDSVKIYNFYSIRNNRKTKLQFERKLRGLLCTKWLSFQQNTMATSSHRAMLICLPAFLGAQSIIGRIALDRGHNIKRIFISPQIYNLDYFSFLGLAPFEVNNELFLLLILL